MDPLIILVFVLAAGFFFVILTRWQRGGDKANSSNQSCCGHDHSQCCDHDHAHDHSHDHGHEHHHHDHKDGGCCGGKH